MNEYDYIVYTDGAYSQMHDEGAFAYVICNSNNEVVKRGAWKIKSETNNRAELKAIIAAIHHLPDDARNVKVVSDSQYALNTLFAGWARNANKDLFESFEKVMSSKDISIDHEWVKGHNGNLYNEMCDDMCNRVLGYDANEEFRKYQRKR